MRSNPTNGSLLSRPLHLSTSMVVAHRASFLSLFQLFESQLAKFHCIFLDSGSAYSTKTGARLSTFRC